MAAAAWRHGSVSRNLRIISGSLFEISSVIQLASERVAGPSVFPFSVCEVHAL
jgi:hypothetical protein